MLKHAFSTVIAVVITAGAVVAHHGGAAYDDSRSVTFEATMTELQFANPHVLVFFDVTNEAGQTENWSGWLTAPNKLARAGWTRRTLNAGDKIVITGTPHKQGQRVIQVRKLIGPGGTELALTEN